jgi:signal transduction histidine kinase
MKRDSISKFWHSAAQCFLGGIGLVLVTFVFFRLGASAATTGFAYLIIIVLLALMGSFIGSVVLSIVAVGCLDYFFTSPLFSFRVDSPEDVSAIVAFLTSSLLVNGVIAKRKRTEDALRQSELYLAAAQRISRTGSFSWRVASGEIIWSEETFRIFEFDQATKPDLETMLQRTHPEDRAVVQQFLERVSHGGKDWELEYRLLIPDGSVRYIHVEAHAVRDQADQLEFIGALMDVTAAKRAEEKLHKAQAELAHVTRVTTLGEMTASIAHEINQPLTAVVANAEACLRWLDRETPDLDAARRSVEWIINDGNRASEVIRRVRALANKTETKKEPLDINSAINEVVPLLKLELINHKVSLRTELVPALPAVLADRVQLHQVIINLVMNSIEAMQSVTDRPRELVIRSRQDETQQVLVSVTDCGVGICAEDADRLFNAFFTTKPSGMGMGLSICRSIMEAHGGGLSASGNEGPGATFQFVLPLHQEEAS